MNDRYRRTWHGGIVRHRRSSGGLSRNRRRESFRHPRIERRSAIRPPRNIRTVDRRARERSGVRRQIIKRNVRGRIHWLPAVRVDGPVERIEFLRREDVALPGEVGGIDSMCRRPHQVRCRCRRVRISSFPSAGTKPSFRRWPIRGVRYGLFSMMASSYARAPDADAGAARCRTPHTSRTSAG